jgi:hypothetical protein
MKLTLQHRNRSFCYAMGHSGQLLIALHRDLAIVGIAAASPDIKNAPSVGRDVTVVGMKTKPSN